MAVPTGVEPVSPAWQAGIINRYTMEPYGAGDRNRTCNPLITSQVHCQLCYTSILVCPERLELSTQWLKVTCSTYWATGTYIPLFNCLCDLSVSIKTHLLNWLHIYYNSFFAILQFFASSNFLVAGVGIEPTTFRLWAWRATSALSRDI